MSVPPIGLNQEANSRRFRVGKTLRERARIAHSRAMLQELPRSDRDEGPRARRLRPMQRAAVPESIARE